MSSRGEVKICAEQKDDTHYNASVLAIPPKPKKGAPAPVIYFSCDVSYQTKNTTVCVQDSVSLDYACTAPVPKTSSTKSGGGKGKAPPSFFLFEIDSMEAGEDFTFSAKMNGLTVIFDSSTVDWTATQ